MINPVRNDVWRLICALSAVCCILHTQSLAQNAAPVAVPKVFLSKGEQALCKVRVGDAMPAIELPKIGGGSARLADNYGKKATLVVFWKSDRRMTHEQLRDLGPDVIEPFGKSGVAVVGIAVNETESSAAAALKSAGADFPNLLDADGQAFAQVGTARLPRTYLLDPSGKILWFDIEYSRATRREIGQALRAVAGAPNAAPSK
jgi:peroxiredoxin